MSTMKFETETEILQKVEQMLEQKDQQKIDLSKHKSEIYEHVQSKIKQLTQAYSPKLTVLGQQLEQLEEKVHKIAETRND